MFKKKAGKAGRAGKEVRSERLKVKSEKTWTVGKLASLKAI